MALLFGQLCKWHRIEINLSLLHGLQPGKQRHKCRFARAVRAKQTNGGCVFNTEIDVTQREVLGVGVAM